MAQLDQAKGTETTKKSPDKKSGILNKTANVLAAAAVITGTQVAANDLLKQCDFNKNGKIDTRKTYKIDGVPKEIAKKEVRCRSDFNIEEGKIVLAQLDMTLENLQKELKEIDEKLSKHKEELSKRKEKLSKNKEDREKKRQWLIEQIRKIKENSINVT